jgi:hypothetical protein
LGFGKFAGLLEEKEFVKTSRAVGFDL